MAHYRKIDCRIWNDAKFRSFSDDGKLAFIFILTHPNLTSLGAMRCSLMGIADELGWLPGRLTESLSEAFREGVLKYDEKAKFLFIPNFLKYNAPESPNVVKAWFNGYDLLPECALKVQLYHHVKAFIEGLSEAFQKAFREAFAKAMPNQEQEQDIRTTSTPTTREPARETPEPEEPADSFTLGESADQILAPEKLDDMPGTSVKEIATQLYIAGVQITHDDLRQEWLRYRMQITGRSRDSPAEWVRRFRGSLIKLQRGQKMGVGNNATFKNAGRKSQAEINDEQLRLIGDIP